MPKIFLSIYSWHGDMSPIWRNTEYEDILEINCLYISDIISDICNISIISAIYLHNTDIDISNKNIASFYHLAIYRSCQIRIRTRNLKFQGKNDVHRTRNKTPTWGRPSSWAQSPSWPRSGFFAPRRSGDGCGLSPDRRHLLKIYKIISWCTSSRHF